MQSAASLAAAGRTQGCANEARAYRKAQRTVNKQEASERNACIMEMATGDSQLGKNYSPHVHAFPVNAEPTRKWLSHYFAWRNKINWIILKITVLHFCFLHLQLVANHYIFIYFF